MKKYLNYYYQTNKPFLMVMLGMLVVWLLLGLLAFLYETQVYPIYNIIVAGNKFGILPTTYQNYFYAFTTFFCFVLGARLLFDIWTSHRDSYYFLEGKSFGRKFILPTAYVSAIILIVGISLLIGHTIFYLNTAAEYQNGFFSFSQIAIIPAVFAVYIYFASAFIIYLMLIHDLIFASDYKYASLHIRLVVIAKELIKGLLMLAILWGTFIIYGRSSGTVTTILSFGLTGIVWICVWLYYFVNYKQFFKTKVNR